MQEMVHQKILAKSKEGSVMITLERINTLIQMVEETKINMNVAQCLINMYLMNYI